MLHLRRFHLRNHGQLQTLPAAASAHSRSPRPSEKQEGSNRMKPNSSMSKRSGGRSPAGRGKGRGKGSKGVRHFTPFRSKGKPKGKGKFSFSTETSTEVTQQTNWDPSSSGTDTAAWSKGKRRKGKKEKSNQDGSTPPQKGKGNQAHAVTEAATSAAQPSSPTASAVVATGHSMDRK